MGVLIVRAHTIHNKFIHKKINERYLLNEYEINDERFITFLLEYQGEQHERPIDFAGKGEMWANEQFEYNQMRDQIKYNYCQKTGYHLEYIWYYEEDKIQALIDLLRKYIKPEFSLDEILANAKMDKTA